jgi:hypothetical protein
MNNENIEKFYFDFVKNNGRMPTNAETGTQLNLELEDIDSFQNSIINDFDTNKKKFAVFTEKILIQLANKAMKGNISAIQEFLKVIHNSNEITANSKQDNQLIVTKVIFENATAKDA